MIRQVKLERIARDISAFEFAAMVGYNPNSWRLVEKGAIEPPESVACRAAEVLGKPEEELFKLVEV